MDGSARRSIGDRNILLDHANARGLPKEIQNRPEDGKEETRKTGKATETIAHSSAKCRGKVFRRRREDRENP